MRLEVLSDSQRDKFQHFENTLNCLRVLDRAIFVPLFISYLYLALGSTHSIPETLLTIIPVWLSCSLASWTVMALGFMADAATTIVGTSAGAVELNKHLSSEPGVDEVVERGVKNIAICSLEQLYFPPLGVVQGIDSLLCASRNLRVIRAQIAANK